MAEPKGKRSWWKIAIAAVIAIEALGGLSGWVSNSGYGNGWFDGLHKPSFMPPGWLFGVVWPILYALLGIALAMVLAQPPSSRRTTALTLFFIQLALNFAWSPVFFAGHDVVLAKWLIVAIALLTAAAALIVVRIRPAAGLLLLPYLAWLIFAASLNWSIDALNPSAGTSLFGS
jgi:tryptophan-rich sensory protein